MAEDSLQPLRDALAFSPENLPLRLHLAESLLKYGRGDEAEREYKEALVRHPKDNKIKLGLAKAYHAQGKFSPSLVIVEDLIKNDDTPAAYILYARLLVQRGEVERAVRVYKQGIELDGSVADLELAAKLGIGADESNDVVDGRIRSNWETSDSEEPGEIERPKVNFSDVGGMESLKEEIRLKIIHPLAHPELYQAYGKAIGGGILMYGPPGCGKTHLARATAGEVKASFLSIGINDVLEMWIGSSERNLHEIFEQARSNKPCVLFFDEVDALGASRSEFKNSAASRHVINQFLAELDGVNTSNEGVLILAATNMPWQLDSAFRRPGRFDRILFVPPPDASARATILRILCKNKPQENIDFDAVAKKTDQFSGADLKAVIDQTIEAKLREAMKTGIPKPMLTKDLIAAAATLKPTTKEWFSTARNYALYANQAGLYDDILKYVK